MAKGKGKGLIYRLTMGKDDLPDFTPNRLPGTRWAQFRDIFKNRLGALVKVNLLVLLFALPAIAWFVIVNLMKTADSSLVAYSGNIGFGYPVVDNAVAVGEYRAFSFEIQRWLIMIPLIMIAGIGLAGGFYVIRRLVWDQGIAVGGDFFRGIKYNFLPFLWSSLFIGVSLFLVMFNIRAYNILDIHVAWKIIGIAVSIIQFVLILFMMMFLSTQAVTYKLKTWGLIKNSFLFAIALVPQNLFFLILTAAPVLLIIFLPQMISMIFIMLFCLIGFSYIMLVWTLYAHSMFDRFINDKVDGAVKNRGLYKRTPEEIERDRAEKAERDRKTRNIRFNNPKKKKKVSSIDEGSTYTPLPTTFSRADLTRLAEEKERVKQEIDAEYDDVDDEAEEDFYDTSEVDTAVNDEATQAADVETLDEETAEKEVADSAVENEKPDEDKSARPQQKTKLKINTGKKK